MSKYERFLIVGIGASAGGIDAAKTFFQAVPENCRMAFVLIQHLDPTHKSMMADLLSRYTTMTVREAVEGVELEPNHVYVIPPDKVLTVKDNRLHTQQFEERRGMRNPINQFFRSLAVERGQQAVGIVVSGTASDGTDGLKEIKLHGGLTIVQDPREAQQAGMPQSAISSGAVDYILPAGEIPALLERYAKHPFVNFDKEHRGTKIDAENDLDAILAILRVRIRHDFRGYKKNTLLRRIERRMSLKDITDTQEYRKLLRDDPQEVNQLLSDLLIGVTSFFREPEAWDLLNEKVIGPMVKNTGENDLLRIWVAGCSTGEEAYTVAILFNEHMERLHKRLSIQLFATDIDLQSLNTAREGLYAADHIENNITPERLSRYFKKHGNTYQIRRDIRDMMTFAAQNIVTDPPFSNMNLICCRNLLIYLENEVQTRLMKLFHFALVKGGFLFLGNSESIGKKSDLFEDVSRKWRIYQKLGTQRPNGLVLPIAHMKRQPVNKKDGKTYEISHVRTGRPAESMTEHALANHFVSAAVLVDAQCKIQYFHGKAEDFLTFPAGEPTQDLLSLVRKGLRSRLRAAVAEAKDQHHFVEFTAPIRTEKTAQMTRVTILPSPEDGLFVVAFRKEGEPLDLKKSDFGPDETVIQSLEEELRSTREELQNTIEELETSNEELKSSNEETMSMNEELQSTNEELETSKEELQSVNEELTTLNSQLKEKLEELEITNDDLDNLINSTDIATLFLASDLRLKRYTPSAIELMNLLPSDIGRPLSDLSSKVSGRMLAEDARQVLEKLQPVACEVKGDAGKWYIRRTLPYRTNRNTVEGVVITFTDVTDIKQAQEKLRNSERKLNLATQAARLGIHDYNPVAGTIDWDDRVRQLWGVDPEHEITYEIFMEGIHPEDRQRTQEAVDKALDPDGDRTYRAEYRVINRQDGREYWVLATGQVFFADGKATRLIGTVHDITDQKLVEGKLIDVNRHLEQQVQRRTRKLTEQAERLKQLAWQLSNAEEQERRRIANLLHDHLQQVMVAAKFQLSVAAKQPHDQMQPVLQKVTDLLEEAITSSRNLTMELSPPVLYDYGLKAALDWLAERLHQQNDFTVNLDCTLDDQAIPEHPRVLLFNCIRELLLNAVKHSGVHKADVSVSQSPKHCICICVHDQGKGFEVNNSGPSKTAGYGLFHIRQRLESIGADIELQSTPGEGTRVTIHCPIKIFKYAPAVTPRLQDIDHQAVDADHEDGVIRILLVDDHEVVRTGLRHTFEEDPQFEVVGEAENGQQAVEEVGRLRPHVVLMDINMPVMNGLDATESITRQFPSVRVVGLSMHEGAAVKGAMQQRGAAAFLHKTVDPDSMIETIVSVMNDPNGKAD